MNPLALLAIALVVAVLVILLINALIGSNTKADTENKPISSHQMTKEQKEAYEKAKKKREWQDPNEYAKYVCHGGQVQCKYCSVPVSKIIVTSTKIKLQDKPWATIKDKVGVKNFNFTGQCLHPSQQKPSSPPPPCKSVINLGDWKNFSQTKIDNYNALVVQATIPCKISGEDLEIIDSGQKATLEQVELSNKVMPKVTKLYWMDDKEREVIETLNPEKGAVLFVETKEFVPNTEITLPMKNSETGEIYELKGVLNGLGKTKIPWPAPLNENETNEYLNEYSTGQQTEGEKSTPLISEIYWYGKNGKYKSSVKRTNDIMLNHSIDLIIKVKYYTKGDIVNLRVKHSGNRRIKGNKKEFEISATIGEDGMATIPGFIIECDFKNDNLDFGYIEFYVGKQTLVAKMKENFGWTCIKDGNIKKIFVNVEIDNSSYIAAGCSIEDYKRQINYQFKRTLELSSEGSVTGQVFFSGTFTRELPQLVPLIYFHNKRPLLGTDYYFLGTQSGGRIEILNDPQDNINLLLDLGESAVHELLHTLRLDHPFEITLCSDTKLVFDNKNVNSYFTTPQTSSSIYYNIMNYGMININGKNLKALWKTKRPEYITKGQLSFILKEIELQRNGLGTFYPLSKTDKDGHEVSIFDYYWTVEEIGVWVNPNVNHN